MSGINITLFGKNSSVYEHLKSGLLKNADKSGLQINLTEVSDTDEFIRNNLKQIPAIQIEEQIIERKELGIEMYLQDISKRILEIAKHTNTRDIIVPTDFSSASLNAITYVQRIIEKLSGHLTYLHVAEPVLVPTIDVLFVDHELLRDKSEQLKQIVADISSTAAETALVAKPELETRIGLPADEIVALSLEKADPFIVMATTGEMGYMKKLFGSVSISVTKRAKCPVLLIPDKAIYKEIERIVFCSDNVAFDSGLASQLVKFAQAFESDLHILHVLGKNSDYNPSAFLQALGRLYPEDKIHYHEVVGTKKAESINSFCVNQDIDVIAMGKKKAGLFHELLSRSLTKRMAINSILPLLILHDS